MTTKHVKTSPRIRGSIRVTNGAATVHIEDQYETSIEGAVRRGLIDGQATLFHDQTYQLAVHGERGLELGLISLTGSHVEQKPARWIAHVDPSRTLPAAGETCPEQAAWPQVAVHMHDPAHHTLRVGDRRPQVLAPVYRELHADPGTE
jgi:hypothetical protein